MQPNNAIPKLGLMYMEIREFLMDYYKGVDNKMFRSGEINVQGTNEPGGYYFERVEASQKNRLILSIMGMSYIHLCKKPEEMTIITHPDFKEISDELIKFTETYLQGVQVIKKTPPRSNPSNIMQQYINLTRGAFGTGTTTSTDWNL
jgi:hypothetical protein